MRYRLVLVLAASGTVNSISVFRNFIKPSPASKDFLRNAPVIKDLLSRVPGYKDLIDCKRERKYAVAKFEEYLETLTAENDLVPAKLEEVYDAAKDYIKSVCPGETVGAKLGDARKKFLKDKKLSDKEIEDRRNNAKKQKRNTVKTQSQFEALIFDAINKKRISDPVLKSDLMELSERVAIEQRDNFDHGLDVPKAHNGQADQGNQEETHYCPELNVGQLKPGPLGLFRRQARESFCYNELVSEAVRAERSGFHLTKMPEYLAVRELPQIPEPENRWEKGVKISPEELCDAVKKLRYDQSEWDKGHRKSIPYLLYDGEVLGDLGRITLGRRLVRKDDVILFNIRNHPEWVIKYQSNCFTLDEYLLDLERDFWFQKLIEGKGIGPRVHFLSPPAKLPVYSTKKNYFDQEWDDYIVCAKNERSYIRYMVMDRIPGTLFDLMRRDNDMIGTPLYPAVKFEMSLNMAKSVIAKLKIMHNLHVNLGNGVLAKGIIHGDVHPGNIAQLKGANFNDFGLIDFGKALFGKEIRDSLGSFSYDASCFISHYAMNGAGVSYRDDVYNTLLSAAFLMTGTEVYGRCMQAASSSRKDIVDFHSRLFLFDLDEKRLVFFRAMGAGSDDQHIQIASHLKNALRLVREVHEVNQKPPYDEIIGELDAALKIFKEG